MTDLVWPSPDYTVKVDGVAVTSVSRSPSGSYASYADNHEVKVEVKPAVPRTACVVRPYRSGRVVTMSAGKASFTTLPGEEVSVEFNGDLSTCWTAARSPT